MAEEEPMDLPGRQEPLQPKPGGLLRAAREERGQSLDEMVVQTKLPRSMLDAIENDNFELLSEPVYVRGYYRKYARVVGADEAAVIAGYEAHAGGQLPKLEIPVLLQDEPLRERRRAPVLLVFLVIIVAAVAVGWWLLSAAPEPVSAGNSSTPPSVARQQVSPPAAQARQPAASAPGAERPATGNRSTTSAGGPRRLALETTMAAAPETAQSDDQPAAEAGVTGEPAAEPAEAVQVPAALVLEFNEASWVRVEDGSGRRVLNGLIQGGETRAIDETGPFSVFLGYAPGVDVSFQGESVDVSQHMRGNNTARFTVE